jgi:hypothetical protein
MNAKMTKVGLPFVDAMSHLNAGNRHGCPFEDLEDEHGYNTRFHAPVALLDDVFEVF